MVDRLTVKASKSPAITITRAAVRSRKLVYIAVANKKLEYKTGWSKIAYIGTTKNGAHRMASSAASKALDMLNIHGVTKLDFYVVVCKSRQNVQSWRKLERGLLLSFKDEYGEPPTCNTQGKNMGWRDEDKYFAAQRLTSVIAHYSA